MMFTPELPIVVKVGYAEAGYGKMMFKDNGALTDFKGYFHSPCCPLNLRCLALHDDYITAESFVEEREYDLRIQKIGNHFRAYKRVNSNWKGVFCLFGLFCSFLFLERSLISRQCRIFDCRRNPHD
jgi:hypothetical protein